MSGLALLIACAGSWQGTNQLQNPNTGEPEVSPSHLTVTPILKESFVRLDYDWGYRDTPQEGSLLVGLQDEAAEYTGHWVDTWHMSHRVMVCRGKAEPSADISVQGSFAAPSGPDWGWRIDIRPQAGERLRLVMHSLSPKGKDYLAVEADYTLSEKAS